MSRSAAKASDTVALNLKRVLADSLRQKLATDKTSVSAFARRIGTGRIAIRRLLDPKNTAVTLKTMTKAVHALGLEITIGVGPKPLAQLEPMIDRYLVAEDSVTASHLEDELVAGYYGQNKRVQISSGSMVNLTGKKKRRSNAQNPALSSAGSIVPASTPKGPGTRNH